MIDDRTTLARTPHHDVALDCVAAGIAAAAPERVIADTVALDGETLTVTVPGRGEGRRDAGSVDLHDVETIVALGGGKAAAGVAAALEDVLGDRLDGGLVVTETAVPTARVTVREGDHPVPTERNVAATRELLDRAAGLDASTLVLGVLTGGASALLAAPAEGLALADLRATTEALLDSGATIAELNAVRKHCSAIKGGRLARAVAPARLCTLALSDVVGDDLSVIGSGPTVPDPSTYADAVAVLDRHEIDVPGAVRTHLEAGAAGEREETPKPGDAAFDRSAAHVVASGATALAAAGDAVPAEYSVAILSSRFEGEASELAAPHIAVAAEVAATGNPIEAPAVVLSGGEATVTVTGDGEGGPNQEFALAAALSLGEIPGVREPGGDSSGALGEAAAGGDRDSDDAGSDASGRPVVVAAVDTDGRDGATDAAGAIVDAGTVPASDRDAATTALDTNDVLPFLAARDALVRTGPTGTNVNDLRVLVVGER